MKTARTGVQSFLKFAAFCKKMNAEYRCLDRMFVAWAQWIVVPPELFSDQAAIAELMEH